MERQSLRACARWNEEHAAGCYRDLKHVKNRRKRDSIERDAVRYTQNAISLNLKARGRLG